MAKEEHADLLDRLNRCHIVPGAHAGPDASANDRGPDRLSGIEAGGNGRATSPTGGRGMTENARPQIKESRRLLEQARLSLELLRDDVARSRELIAETKRLLMVADGAAARATILLVTNLIGP
jgi:hypothetical protein